MKAEFCYSLQRAWTLGIKLMQQLRRIYDNFDANSLLFLHWIRRPIHSAQPDFSKRSSCLIRSDAERFGRFNVAGTQRYLLVRRVNIHEFFFINPCFDTRLGHSQSDPVPPALLGIQKFRRLVFRRVLAIKTRYTNKRAAPTAND